ncbi:unnamed protein product [Strongylus vulgaris]|uniref:GOLD domain-containing protein n=1 Tax=Strongylus vulgaris TaxID=40348 RepID=A0A3P7IHJ1_STRVU|nr:unnamed protein product [Strongylus vulgaris]
MSMRLTSPSGEFSEWAEGPGEAYMKHNVTEDGDYEICVNAPRPVKVNLNIFFHNPEKMEKSLDRYLKAHELKGNVRVSSFSTFIIYIIFFLLSYFLQKHSERYHINNGTALQYSLLYQILQQSNQSF